MRSQFENLVQIFEKKGLEVHLRVTNLHPYHIV
jgi:hypothetical protein